MSDINTILGEIKTLISANGLTVVYEFNSLPIIREKGEVVGVIGIKAMNSKSAYPLAGKISSSFELTFRLNLIAEEGTPVTSLYNALEESVLNALIASSYNILEISAEPARTDFKLQKLVLPAEFKLLCEESQELII